MKRTFYKSYGLYSLKEMEEMKKDYKTNFMDDLEIEEEDIEEAIINYINQDWDCFIDEITYSKLGALECVIEGVLGLWNGKYTIIPTNDILTNCITRCIGESDEVEIYEEDGVLKIDGYHHDGCNHFTINLASGLPLNLMNKIYGA
jgi:hypothetical protein